MTELLAYGNARPGLELLSSAIANGWTFARDLLRAQREWNGERHVWLMPDAKAIARWEGSNGGLIHRECIIPSEEFGWLTVFHVDEARRVYPSLRSNGFPDGRLPEGLYATWLRARPKMAEEYESVTLSVPVVSKDGVRYVDREFEIEPSAILLGVGAAGSNHEIAAVWPPLEPEHPPIVSPEIESNKADAPLLRVHVGSGEDSSTLVVSEKNPEVRAIRISLQWPEPFDMLLPGGGGEDVLYHQAVMRRCIERYAAHWA